MEIHDQPQFSCCFFYSIVINILSLDTTSTRASYMRNELEWAREIIEEMSTVRHRKEL